MVVLPTGGSMTREDAPEQPEGAHPSDDPYIDSTGDFAQSTTDLNAAAQQASQAKRARTANRRRGEFRWYEFRARRRYRTH